MEKFHFIRFQFFARILDELNQVDMKPAGQSEQVGCGEYP